MIRVAAYCRVSTDKEDQWNSLESQKTYFHGYIEKHPDWKLYQIYADEGISGTSTRKRSAFNQMMNDAYDGKFRLILTKEVSRFSRNILDTISYTRELKQLEVYVIFLNDGFSTQDADCELRLSYMGSAAQEESRKTSMRVTWGQQRQMEKGIVFGRSMLGYDVEGGTITVNPEGAELVRLIYHKYTLEQTGTAALARYLRDRGYRTSHGNSNWSTGQIIKILKNEKYTGDLVQRKTYTPDYLTHEKKINHGEVDKIIIKDHHEPIINRELWNLTQEALAERRKQPNTAVSSNGHLFSGKIRCGECGSSYVSRVKTNTCGFKYRRWSCSKTVSAQTERCNVGKLLRDDDALGIIKQAIKSLRLEKEAILSSVTTLVLKAMQTGERGLNDNAERLEYEISRIQEKQERLLDAFLSRTISESELKTMKSRYQSQILEIQNRINTLKDRNHHAQMIQQKDAIRHRLEDILEGEYISPVFCKTILDRITVFKDRHLELRFQNLPVVFHFL